MPDGNTAGETAGSQRVDELVEPTVTEVRVPGHDDELAERRRSRFAARGSGDDDRQAHGATPLIEGGGVGFRGLPRDGQRVVPGGSRRAATQRSVGRNVQHHERGQGRDARGAPSETHVSRVTGQPAILS